MTLDEILVAKEGENFEFKRAENAFSYTELQKYASALANEGGGKIVFGVSDVRPRKVVGSKAFEQPERVRKNLIETLHVNVDFELFNESTPQRVLMFAVPSRPLGLPVQVNGVAWWRDGDSLIPMPENIRLKIYEESGRDFSAEVCDGATLDDLDGQAIETFRKVWMEKRGNRQIENVSREQLLRDCEAITRKGGITYAALILFGTHEALGEFLANSETIFEYHVNDASGPAGQRREFREGFFLYFDQLWDIVNLRNLKLPYQEGFFLYDVYAYNERAVREAVLNAVCHRNYQLPGSVFVRQYPDRIVFESPGGFIGDITPENVIDRQSARNRRLAEILSRCGLVERSGQGMNLIYEESVKDAKSLPDFDGTNESRVRLTLGAVMVDDSIIKLFKVIGDQKMASFSTEDFLLVHNVLLNERILPPLKKRVARLVELGVLERVGRSRVLVARQYYKAIGKAGTFTRLKGLDAETNKALLLSHMRDTGNAGVKLSQFQSVLPALGVRQIQWLLKDMESAGTAYSLGRTNAARWYAGKRTDSCELTSSPQVDAAEKSTDFTLNAEECSDSDAP
jgi:ATP-dependent DNA helicase RecG